MAKARSGATGIITVNKPSKVRRKNTSLATSDPRQVAQETEAPWCRWWGPLAPISGTIQTIDNASSAMRSIRTIIKFIGMWHRGASQTIVLKANTGSSPVPLRLISNRVPPMPRFVLAEDPISTRSHQAACAKFVLEVLKND